MDYIKKEDVEYLVFEGGGGAGNAFPGALNALEELKILQFKKNKVVGKIRGFGGASAGAINALFLSLGYSPSEMQTILDQNNFEDFFDTPNITHRPYTFTAKKSTKVKDDLAKLAKELEQGVFGNIFKYCFGWILSNKAISSLAWGTIAAGYTMLSYFFGAALSAISIVMMGKMPQQMLKKIKDNLKNNKVQFSLLFHYGIFPGFTFRHFLNKYIKLAVNRVGASDISGDEITISGVKKKIQDINFADHEKIFGIKLIVTGTNLETMKSVQFSSLTTPNFPIADAVRISMSIPMAFQPLILKDDNDLRQVIKSGENPRNHFLKGVWVDGGLLNNAPVAAFDQIAGTHTKTLALRLRQDERSEIETVFDFFKIYPLSLGLMGTGEAYIDNAASPFDRTINIKVKNSEMGLFDFKVDKATFTKVNDRSKKTVKDFFASAAAIQRIKDEAQKTGSGEYPVNDL